MPEELTQSPYAGVIQDLKGRRERLAAEMEKLDRALMALEELSGGDYALTGEITATVAGDPMIKVGEFHGLGIPNAARMILEKTNKHPLTTNDILRLLEKSGRKIEAKYPIGNIYSSLKRNPDFTLVAPNTWGLTEWYPGAKKKVAKQSVAAKVEEIMRRGTISIAEATKQAERELGGEVDAEDFVPMEKA